MEKNIPGSGWSQGIPAAKVPFVAPMKLPEPMPMPTPTPLPEPMPMPTPTPLPEPAPMPMPPVIQPPQMCGNMVLAMSYVKMQEWDQVYEAEAALERGTIFPELDLPFAGEGACRNE